MTLIVADSGPLIIFARSGRLDLLCALAETVIVPAAVLQECTGNAARPGAAAILQALRSGKLRVQPAAVMRGDLLERLAVLDEGETAAIALALELQAALLMDERLGRRVARGYGIAVIGSGGVLLKAKQLGLIDAVRPILDGWRQDIGYFMSDALRNEILLRAGETS